MADFLESTGYCNPSSANWHPNVLVSLLLFKITRTVELLNQLEDSKVRQTDEQSSDEKDTPDINTVELLNQLEDSKVFLSLLLLKVTHTVSY